MIIQLKNNVSDSIAQKIASALSSPYIMDDASHIIITSSKLKTVPEEFSEYIASVIVTESDIQLASRAYKKQTRAVRINDLVIGGNTNNTLVITGPCSIESREQIKSAAEFLKKLNLTTLRAGCFKPRTSPYSFQGLGTLGLKMLSEIRAEYGFNIITEVRDATHVEEVIHYADIVQIGAKAMYDHGVLRACGRQQKPVLLKRGFGSTLQEFVQAAEFILSEGNPNVILCERGIRTFENKTRFTLDLCGVAYLKEFTNLPIILDTSHAMGFRYGVPDLTRACIAMGVDGILIESHPDPTVALSDAAQQLDFEAFQELYHSLLPVAKAVNRTLI